jgi:hypothetical protein
MHIDNLTGILQRGGMYAPNHIPHDGIGYRAIHHQHIQERRTARSVPCGPGGVIHDYVPFYFGSLPPMLLALRDGYVFGYNEGQEPLIYLINFPTKHHWKAKSRIEDIKRGLAALIDEVQRLEITSIAVPPLGCGNADSIGLTYVHSLRKPSPCCLMCMSCSMLPQARRMLTLCLCGRQSQR